MDAGNVLEDPAGRRILHRVPVLSGTGDLVGLAYLPATIIQGRIDRQADGRAPKPRPNPHRLLEVEHGGRQPRPF
jgi:hypothetical protein